MSSPELALKREHVLERLTTSDDGALSFVDQHFGSQHVAFVGGRHHGSVRTGIEDRNQIVNFKGRKLSVPRENITALADRTDNVPGGFGPTPRNDRHDAGKGPVERGPNQLAHPRVEHGELAAIRKALRVDDARDESA